MVQVRHIFQIIFIFLLMTGICSFSFAEELIQNELGELELPKCAAKGGKTIYSPGSCGKYQVLISEDKIDSKSEHGSRYLCCAPEKGMKFMNVEEDCKKAGGYIVGDGPAASQLECVNGDIVIGIMTNYSLGPYYCCKKAN